MGERTATRPTTPEATRRSFTGQALGTVIDLATREVIGYAIADHHRAELVADALKMAAGRGALREGCIAHSDRGSEYTSHEYRTLIRELKLR
ncbi:DDE-type integrase/transposase/recombinase [Streptomyces sp. NPDC058728]|uniref:DDE-type integrase/transposase/recombinase n=1 Tax=Streptomyces sp. NPDC058728 TaxID=3346612 RepID=UPI0036749476